MPRRRKSMRYDLIRARLEIEMAGADPEQAGKIEQQLRDLEALRDELQHPVAAPELMHVARYKQLVDVWHQALLAGSCQWDLLLQVHEALRRLEVVGGLEATSEPAASTHAGTTR